MKWLQLHSKRRLLLKKRNGTIKRPESLLTRDHKFDESTGQVFKETTAAIQGMNDPNDRDWTQRTRVVIGPDYLDSEDYDELLHIWEPGESEASLDGFHDYMDGMKNSRVRGFRGARSLQDTAIECILNNISDVTFEGMQCLPDQMVRRIWHAVNKRSVYRLMLSNFLHFSVFDTIDVPPQVFSSLVVNQWVESLRVAQFCLKSPSRCSRRGC